MRSTTFALAAMLAAAGAGLFPTAASAAPADKEKLRSLALYVIGVGGVWVPGVAAYCDANVEANPSLLQAAAEWRKRNRAHVARAVEVLQWSGGMTQAEKDRFNRSGVATLKREVNEEADRAGYCRQVAQGMASGQLDLDARADTAKMVRALAAADLR